MNGDESHTVTLLDNDTARVSISRWSDSEDSGHDLQLEPPDVLGALVEVFLTPESALSLAGALRMAATLTAPVQAAQPGDAR